MTFRFHPTQLAAARNAEMLRRLAFEMIEPETPCEMDILSSFPDRRTRVVLSAPGEKPVTVELPHYWLYLDLTDAEFRSRLASLLPTSRRAES